MCKLDEKFPKWDEDRIDVIGQNGNDGLHYDALKEQIGGGHYKGLQIQPVEYIYRNNIPYFEGNVIKYITRWRDKGGKADLEKAKHYIDLLIQMEFGNDTGVY